MSKRAPTEQAVAVLQELASKHCLNAKAVVDAARSVDSPLHEYFTWDNEKASELWREEEARSLIGSVKLNVEVEEIKVVVPRYVRDVRKTETGSGYTELLGYRKRPAQAKRLMLYEFGRAEAHLMRAARIAIAIGHEQDVRDIVKAIQTLKRSLEG